MFENKALTAVNRKTNHVLARAKLLVRCAEKARYYGRHEITLPLTAPANEAVRSLEVFRILATAEGRR